MHAGNATLHAVNMQTTLGQLDLQPSQVAHLRGPQPVAVGDQDHGCVAMAVAAMLSRAAHQPLDLALGEVAPLDCQVYDAWGAFPGSRFHADKPCLRVSHCAGYTHFLNSFLVSDVLSVTSRAAKGLCSSAVEIKLASFGKSWVAKTADGSTFELDLPTPRDPPHPPFLDFENCI